MIRAAVVVAVAVELASCGADPAPPVHNTAVAPGAPAASTKETQCLQLLDHLIDLEFRKAMAGATTDEERHELGQRKEGIRAHKAPEFVPECLKLTIPQIKCALAARDLHELESCDPRLASAFDPPS